VKEMFQKKSRSRIKPRPVTSLGHQGGRSVFCEGPNFFTLCPIDLNYVQKHFSTGGEKFPKGLRPLVTALIEPLWRTGSYGTIKCHSFSPDVFDH